MILLFGMSTIPVAYAFSYLFSSPAGGFTFIIIFYLVFGLIGNIIFSILHILNHYSHFDILTNWVVSLLMIARIVPIFSLLYGYQKVYLLSAMNGLCKSFKDIDTVCKSLPHDSKSLISGCCPSICGNQCYSKQNAFNFTPLGAGIELVYLFVTGIFFFSLILIFESKFKFKI